MPQNADYFIATARQTAHNCRLFCCMGEGYSIKPKYKCQRPSASSCAALRGVFKKFAAQPRRKTNFRTQRGVRDVTLLKRPLTQPLANQSSCFAQAVGCCKNVCYFCRTQRRSAGSSDSIRSITEKCHKGYPRILVGNTGGMLSSL